MTLAFDARANGSRRVRWLDASAQIVGGAGAGLLLCRIPGVDPDALPAPGLALCGAALAAFAVGLAGRWRRLRPSPTLILRVSATGEATLSDDQGTARADRPFQPVRWIAAGGVAWVMGATADATRAHRLAFGRDALAEADWRALRRWLRWLERGGHEPAPDPLVIDGACKPAEASPSRAASPQAPQGMVPSRDPVPLKRSNP